MFSKNVNYLLVAVLLVFMLKIAAETHQGVIKQKAHHTRLIDAYTFMFGSICSPSAIEEFGDTFLDLSSNESKGKLLRCGELMNKRYSKPPGYYEKLDELYINDVRKLAFWVYEYYVFIRLQFVYWLDCSKFVGLKNAFIKLGVNLPGEWTNDTDNSCSLLRYTVEIGVAAVLISVLIAVTVSVCLYVIFYLVQNSVHSFRLCMQNCRGFRAPIDPQHGPLHAL
jgi:hypothetical protein